jgi:hypothetical protein
MGYSYDEKAEIMRTARGLLTDDTTALLAYEPAPEDALTRWRREAEELEARRAQYRERTAAEINAEHAAGWDRYVRGHIANALAEHDRHLTEVLGELVAEERRRHRGELAKFEARITALENHQRGVTSDVVDLPVVRKVKDNNAA